MIAPPKTEKEARPYNLDVLQKSFDVIEDGKVLRERDLQEKIDKVFTEIDFMKIEEHSVFKSDGSMNMGKLIHRGKAILFELLEIKEHPEHFTLITHSYFRVLTTGLLSFSILRHI